LNIRYRRVLAGRDVNKSDFAIKYKEAAPFYPNLKPMTASAEWEDAYTCKVEDNFINISSAPTKLAFRLETAIRHALSLARLE